MSAGFRFSTVILALIAVAACSEDSTAPGGQQELDRVAGVWHVVSRTWNETTTPFPEGNTYWHFKNDGQYCSETITGHGYRIWACGEVTRSLVLTEIYPSEVIRKSQLVLAADGDSLSSRLIEATGPVSTRFDLVRAVDREAIACDCE